MSIGTFTIDGRSYPLVLPNEMTLGEQRELKRLSGGMTPVKVADAIRELDPDALTGILLVSMRRVDPSTKDTDIEGVDTFSLMKALAATLTPPEDPPTAAGAAAAAPPASS